MATSMQATTTPHGRVPWGISRMRPYPSTYQAGYATAELDSTTQATVFRDPRGGIVEMGKHGTSKGTETRPQSTNQDSRNDTDHDQDSEQD
ncbi:putative ATP-grasp-modified RiPP [Streptomyces sp. NPDC090023]|uniref:putative ATP-grasp-modified RiPP n=1 Tax=unclassified Streptomyces TaxID=2593676 RepID=UPI0037FFB76C